MAMCPYKRRGRTLPRAPRAQDNYSKSKEVSRAGSQHRKDNNEQDQDRSNKGESVVVRPGASLVHSEISR